VLGIVACNLAVHPPTGGQGKVTVTALVALAENPGQDYSATPGLPALQSPAALPAAVTLPPGAQTAQAPVTARGLLLHWLSHLTARPWLVLV